MTIKVNFFNNTEYEYYAEDFNRQFMYLVSTNGVADKNSFPVGPQGTPNGTVTVGTGAAWWNGQFIYSDSAEILSVNPNETLEERIDCVVLNIDKLNLNASLEVVTKGLTTDDMIILAEINMPGSTSIVTQGQITDCRNFVTIKDELVQKFHDFFKNGGEIGGAIKGVTGTTGHRFLEHTGIFNSRNALLRVSTANMNGYPAIINMIEDLDNPDNSNGFAFLLGNGKDGDAYRNSFFRPVSPAYGFGSMSLGSATFPWDRLYLKGGKMYFTDVVGSNGSCVIETDKGKQLILNVTSSDGTKVNQLKMYSSDDGSRGIIPSINNVISLGSNDFRFTDIFAGNHSKSTNGYTKLPNGFILQWGVLSNFAANSRTTITYPIKFPNNYIGFFTQFRGDSSAVWTFAIDNANGITFDLIPKLMSGSNALARVCHWFALGY